MSKLGKKLNILHGRFLSLKKKKEQKVWQLFSYKHVLLTSMEAFTLKLVNIRLLSSASEH